MSASVEQNNAIEFIRGTGGASVGFAQFDWRGVGAVFSSAAAAVQAVGAAVSVTGRPSPAREPAAGAGVVLEGAGSFGCATVAAAAAHRPDERRHRAPRRAGAGPRAAAAAASRRCRRLPPPAPARARAPV